jgi:hypothetical protein
VAAKTSFVSSRGGSRSRASSAWALSGTRRREPTVFGYGVRVPFAYRRCTRTAGPERSTSRRSNGIHSFVRSPVSAANTTIGPNTGPNSTASTSISSGDRAVLEISDIVHELAERFTILECAFDPWRAGQIGQELEQRGIRVSAFPQQDARMFPASQRLYDAIVEGRIVHGNDPQLNAPVATAIARHGRRGWRIDKANRADKVDAVVSLAMALDRLEDRPAPVKLLGKPVRKPV